MKKKKAKHYGSGAYLLDPLHCGSSIRWRIAYSRYGALTGGIDLSDCSRQITWELHAENETPALAKLDKAITVLHEIRAKWIVAKAEYDKLETKAKKRKKARRTT